MPDDAAPAPKILILYNPVAGGGRAERVAGEVAEQLRRAGCPATCLISRPDAGGTWLDEALAGCDVLVAAGGDGAVRAAAGAAMRTRTPLYHLPCGVSNLFAREFGMDRRAETLLAALRRRNVEWLDAGDADGRTFLLMASVGYDAEVVHDLAARRGRTTSYFSYLGPMRRCMIHWRPPVLEVTVGGQRIDPGQPGMVIVANCRRYAFALDPARRADMTDGKFDVLYFPVRNRRELAAWIVRCRLGWHLRDPRLVTARGAEVEISCADPQRFQIDGDPPEGGATARRLRFTVRPRALPVLLP